MKSLAEKLLALATCPGTTEEERRSAAMKVCRWLADTDYLRRSTIREGVPFEDPELARQGSVVPHGNGPLMICWTRQQARMLGRSRNESTGTRDPEAALVYFVKRRASLFGDP